MYRPRYIFWLLLVMMINLIIPSTSNAQISARGLKRTMFTIQAGYLSPRDIDKSMLVGAMIMSNFDDAVDLGLGFDVFQKTYTRETEVEDEQFRSNYAQVQFKRTAIPLYATIRVKIPGLFSSQTEGRSFGPFARVSLSYQFLNSEDNNYEAGIKEKRRYKGLGWQAGAGFYYRVGSRSTLIAEALYNNCIVSRDISNPKHSLPMSERVNLSGIGIRIGVELDL